MAINTRFIVKNGLDNNANSITNIGVSGASLAQAGAFSVTLTSTGTTNVTLPTSGTLAVEGGGVTNLLGGAAGQIHYQSAAATTLFSAAGTAGQILISGGTGAPTWTSLPSVSLIPTLTTHATSKSYVDSKLTNSFPAGALGQVPFVDVDGSNSASNDYLVVSGAFTNDSAELATAKSNVITNATVFNTWQRFSHIRDSPGFFTRTSNVTNFRFISGNTTSLALSFPVGAVVTMLSTTADSSYAGTFTITAVTALGGRHNIQYTNTGANSQAVTFVASPSGTASTVMTISSVTSGTVTVGMLVTGTGLSGAARISSFGTFNGTSGTVNLSAAQTWANNLNVICQLSGAINLATLQPGLSDELSAWTYDVPTDTIASTINSDSYIGFISNKTYTKYTLEAKLSSGNNDDDIIAVVAAWYVDPITGRQNTLSVVRSPGGFAPTWGLVYNYARNDQVTIVDGTTLVTWGNNNTGASASAASYVSQTPGWGNMAAFQGTDGSTKVRVVRDGDTITVDTSNWATPTVYAAGSVLTINLETDTNSALLAKFRGPRSYGYAANSQALATVKVLAFSDPTNVIYDLNLDQVWVYNNTSSIWQIDATKSFSNDVGYGRLLFNESTKKTFFVRNDSSVELVSTSTLDTAFVNLIGGTMSGPLTLSADPTLNLHAATKQYVDNVATGLDMKASSRVATTANITLSGTQTIDGIAVIAGDRVLVKNQSTLSQNGVYVVAAGAWARSADADNSPGIEVTAGFYTFVTEGNTNADSGWVLITDGVIVLGTTALTFVQFTGLGQVTAGAGLSKTGNTIDIGTASATRIVVNADNIDLATTAISAGTYNQLTVDTYGRATAGTSLQTGTGTTYVTNTAPTISNAILSGVGTIGTGTFGSWAAADTDIDSLIAGTSAGSLIEGASNAHFTIGLRSNDVTDGFQIISKGNAANPTTDPYTILAFEVKSTGAVTAGASLTVPFVAITAVTATTLASTANPIQIGSSASLNMVFDTNEIQARSNGAASALNLNILGGNVAIGSPNAAVLIEGISTFTSVVLIDRDPFAGPVSSGQGTALRVRPGTHTDTTAGNVITRVSTHFSAPVFTSSSAKTYTDASTVFIFNAPSVDSTGGFSPTVTNFHALHISGGRTFMSATGTSASIPSIAIRDPNSGFFSSAVDTIDTVINGVSALVVKATTVNMVAGSGALRTNGHISRFESAQLTLPTTSGNSIATHGGTRVPDMVRAVYRCLTAEHGFAVGNEIDAEIDVGTTDRSLQLASSTVSVSFRWVSTSSLAPTIRNTSNALVVLTVANWRLVMYALWL